MHFANVATKLIDDCNDKGNADNSYVTSNVSNPRSRLDLPSVTPEFVDKEIRNMSTSKATGLDNVSCKILKLGRPAIVSSLTYLINFSLSNGVFPSAWKEAKVFPLHKGGDVDSRTITDPFLYYLLLVKSLKGLYIIMFTLMLLKIVF